MDGSILVPAHVCRFVWILEYLIWDFSWEAIWWRGTHPCTYIYIYIYIHIFTYIHIYYLGFGYWTSTLPFQVLRHFDPGDGEDQTPGDGESQQSSSHCWDEPLQEGGGSAAGCFCDVWCDQIDLENIVKNENAMGSFGKMDVWEEWCSNIYLFERSFIRSTMYKRYRMCWINSDILSSWYVWYQIDLAQRQKCLIMQVDNNTKQSLARMASMMVSPHKNEEL